MTKKTIADLLRALAEAARKKADELDPPPPAPAPSPDEGGPGGQPR